MVAAHEKPRMNEGGSGNHGFRCGFLGTFFPAKKVPHTFKTAFKLFEMFFKG
jgi:hypothetical protein